VTRAIPRGAERQTSAGTLDVVNIAKTEGPAGFVAEPPLHPEDNWLEFIGAGVVGGFAGGVGTDVYNDVKAICRTAVEKYRDSDPDPDEESEYLHQLVAEAFIGPCPHGHKLAHLNGNGLDNRRANLAYVPESDPRPGAPLKSRPPGWFTNPVGTRKKRSKGSHRSTKRLRQSANSFH
jgi:hypothetical protein